MLQNIKVVSTPSTEQAHFHLSESEHYLNSYYGEVTNTALQEIL